MNTRSTLFRSVVAAACCLGAGAQSPVVTSFHGSGQLTWTNAPGTNAFRIQWAGALADSNAWKSTWWDLDYLAGTSTSSSVTVPMAFRVVRETNEFHRGSLGGAWLFFNTDQYPDVITESHSIYLLSDGSGDIREHSGFNNGGPKTGFYDVNPDGSFSIGLNMGGNPIVTVGRLLSSGEGVIQPPFAGARVIRVPEENVCQGTWVGTLTEYGSPLLPSNLSFTVTADGAVTNLGGFAGPASNSHFFALSASNGIARGCIRTREPGSNPYNQISIRGVLATNQIIGVYEIDTGLGEDGTVRLDRIP